MSDVNDAADEEVPSYPVSQARMRQFQANSLAAGAGGVPGGPGGPLSQGAAPAQPALAALQFQGPYQAIYQQMQQQAQQKQQAQQAYLDSLQKQEGALGQAGMSDLDRASLLFQAAGALGQTTRSGGFGETLGNLGTAMAGPLSKQAEAQRQRQTQLQQLQAARAKLGMEMAGQGVSPADMLSLVKAQQDAQPKLTDTQRLLQDPTLTPEERKLGLRKALKLDETEKEQKEETKNIKLRDGTEISVVRRGGRSYDPITNELLDEAKLNALTAATQTSDQKDHALELGVPVQTRDAYAALSPKEKEKAKINRYNTDTRMLQKENTDLPDSSLRDEIQKNNMFVALNNENRSTGVFWGKTPNITPSAQRMAAIESELTIGAGKDLKGAASDRDVKMFGNAVPSVYKDFEANSKIAEYNALKLRTELERRSFMRDYLAVNRNLDNAENKWKEYLNANPFFKYPDKFDPAKIDISKLQRNDKRQSYQDYFRDQVGRGATAVTRDAEGKLVIERQ